MEATPAGISVIFGAVLACSAAWAMISSSESPRATKSQPGIRSLQRRIFGMMDLLARQGEGTWRDARRSPRTSQSREADSFVKPLRHQNVAAGYPGGAVPGERRE